MALTEEDKEEIKQIVRKEIHDGFVEAFREVSISSPDKDVQEIAMKILQWGKMKLSERLNS